jgi:hypothetical protein
LIEMLASVIDVGAPLYTRCNVFRCNVFEIGKGWLAGHARPGGEVVAYELREAKDGSTNMAGE